MRVLEEWGGWQVLLALGNPVGGSCTTGSGRCGDLATGVSEDRIANAYAASAETGWLILPGYDSASRTLLEHLVTTVADLGLIAANQAAAVFG